MADEILRRVTRPNWQTAGSPHGRLPPLGRVFPLQRGCIFILVASEVSRGVYVTIYRGVLSGAGE